MKTHNEAHPLIKSILDAAERQGLTQIAVAQRAQMAPESFSRVIRTGRMELGTLERLMAAVGLRLRTSPDTTVVAHTA